MSLIRKIRIFAPAVGSSAPMFPGERNERYTRTGRAYRGNTNFYYAIIYIRKAIKFPPGARDVNLMMHYAYQRLRPACPYFAFVFNSLKCKNEILCIYVK